MYIILLCIICNYCVYVYVFCTIADCPLLSPPEHGHIINATGNTINDTIVIECFENFTLMGSGIRRCQSKGQWSGNVTKCVGKLTSYSLSLYMCIYVSTKSIYKIHHIYAILNIYVVCLP